ncbi:putative nuclease HARBI1 [Polypterus senegalus]|uniref:putative nuclease HARBI1 n=1 Tax=Polypterus senegalus TaxID=55291 RepID=UPI001966C4D7|nr:putative nuclease HARBI1 [Polypterus senegalus]
MADLVLLEDLQQALLRRDRIFRDRTDLLAESDEWLISRFRLPRPILLDLCQQFSQLLERPTKRTSAVPVHTQVLSTIGFLATGTFQREIGDRSGISQPTVSRIMPHVLHAIISLTSQYITFPNTAAERTQIMTDFYNITGFPSVIGAVDCTHVALKAPTVDEFAFQNRKGYHSINVQVICDAHLNLLNVVANSPGGTHDSFIVQNSIMGLRFEQSAAGEGWLFGDRGYALKFWLMTPVANPVSQKELNYNRAHERTRSSVECAIGLLKARWLCLSDRGGILQYKPDKVCYIVKACSVLHNIAIKNGIPLDEMPIQEDRHMAEGFDPMPNAVAMQLRAGIIEWF